MKNTAICPPEWLSKGSIYQINPRTFSNEGTLNAITEELPFLKEMGFSIIYLCSICTSDDSEDPDTFSPRQKASETGNPKNMYILKDYFSIDDEYGNMDDLKALVDKAHSLGMSVLLDLVYAHIGLSAEIVKEHPDFVVQNADGSFALTKWNSLTVDIRSEGMREYLYTNMVYYIAQIGVDGFRCDVGDMLPVYFWREARRRIQAIKRDAVLVNESASYVNMVTAFDSTYCFPWHDTMRRVFCHEEPASDLKKVYETELQKVPSGAVLLRDMDNHDTVTDWKIRTETFAGNDGMEQIQVINYLIDGIPMVYCGNELACEADLNMFANRFYPGRFEVTDRTKKNTEASLRRQSIMKTLNKMKSESEILLNGKTEWIDTNCPENVVAFKRVLGEKEIVFVGNVKDTEVTVSIGDILENKEALLFNGAHRYESGDLYLSAREYAVFEAK
ncbi:MAG: hypothetical protein IJZ03_06875 [Clostridia bacterium]|nr:hypothetical protein [Clostridia bacterium]